MAYPANLHVVTTDRPTIPAHRDFEPVQKPGTAGPGRPDTGPAPHSADPRYTRPDSHGVRPPPYAHDRPPIVHSYAGWYTGWYCHPWYRWTWGTYAVVSFGFWVDPWVVWWVPPSRWGWTWYPGYWSYGVWWPGYWGPVAYAPMGYVYVPGWWENTVYVEGYYRVEDRDGWEWVDGYYLEDGTHVRGHWRPTGEWPEGYTWEAGFWDGQDYHDGFWRPEFRAGYVWISASYDQDGVYHAGYWAPLEDKPGYQWVPGWFDGNEWIPGYWVSDEEVQNEDVDAWKPPPAHDSGHQDTPMQEAPTTGGDAPLAIPVPIAPPER